MIRIRKIKGHLLGAGRYKFTIRAVVGHLRGRPHTFTVRIKLQAEARWRGTPGAAPRFSA